MEDFSQLLNRYIQQAGISDTELARSLGVSRQTIFRWREGQTSRPRRREDVLVIAQKLRLTPAERDGLLLAAGFRPEENLIPEPEDATAGAEPSGAGHSTSPLTLPASQLIEDPPAVSTAQAISTDPVARRLSLPLLAAIVLGVILLSGASLWWLQGPAGETTGRVTIEGPGYPAGPGGPTPFPATGAESLILVTHFANYASSQVGYNVAGRLAESLQQEIDQGHIPRLRVTIWPEIVDTPQEALQAGQVVSATLVIYGEYDVGRIVVKFASPPGLDPISFPALQRDVLDVQALSATINGDIPQQVRSLALLALGQIYLNQGDAAQAQALLLQARDKLQGQVEPRTLALANFFLGIAYQRQQPPALDQAIAAYTQAITNWPGMLSPYINRSAAYTARGQAGDLQQALADINKVIKAEPGWGLAYHNRASIHLQRGSPEDIGLALTDLDQALALEPDLPQAHFNRAFIYLQQGLPLDKVTPELDKALDLRPDYGAAFNLLCWSYALEQQLEQARPNCRQALQLEPGRADFQDSRGLVYALEGDYPAAIADFEAYIAWLEQEQPFPHWRKDLTRRQEWVETLKTGENPFTQALLRELRGEFGE